MARVKGMFLRGGVWWLRYTPSKGKPQQRLSLETPFEQVASVKAVQILQRAPLEPSGDFDDELMRYFADARDKGRLTERTVRERKFVLKGFARDCGVTRISQISLPVVERWVEMLKGGKGERVSRETGDGAKGKGGNRKKGAVSPVTLDSYVFQLRAFCRWLMARNKMRENPAKAVDIGKVERVGRKVFVVAPKVRQLIADAPNDDLRFVLYCGFHLGLRKLEVVEAAPQWFHLEPAGSNRRGRVSVGKTDTFSPKDRDERTIPLTAEFEEFLRGYLARLDPDARWVLRPEVKPGRWRYRYDFRVPWEAFATAQGISTRFHDARRSFVSNKLIENSSLIFKLAKWTGDDVRVLQRHYAHLLEDDEDIEVGI